MADFADRSLGIGYPGGAALLLALLLSTLSLWYWTLGSISVETVATPKVETFYWAAIMSSLTLGMALGDWMADSMALGYYGEHWFSPPAWRSWRRPISGPTSGGRFCSGRPSS